MRHGDRDNSIREQADLFVVVHVDKMLPVVIQPRDVDLFWK